MSARDESSVTLELSGYLPRIHVNALAEHGFAPSPMHGAIRGAVLFADIAGFSTQTEALGRSGPRGAEELSTLLEANFGELTDTIESWGGDVIVFAGDAVLALWPAKGSDALESAVEYAAACALNLQAVLRNLLLPGGRRFGARMSLAAGEVEYHQVGGVGGRWFYCIGGSAVADVIEVDGSARPGVLCAAADIARLAPRLRTSAADGALAVEGSPQRDPPGEIRLAQVSLDQLTPFLPAAVHARHVSGQTQFLGEFRTMTIVFFGFSPPRSQPELLQEIVGVVQSSVESFDGELYQVLVDDKGLVAVAAFGMPMRSHENDAERAVRAAIDVQNDLRAGAARSSIGVSTGRLFCGSYGGRHRRQYSIMGTTINRAARLMQAAETIYVDAATGSAAPGIEYHESTSLKLKGFAQPHRVAVPTGRDVRRESLERVDLVGRNEQLETIVGALAGAHRAHGMAHVLVEAEAGLGKSTLLSASLQAIDADEMLFVRSATSAIDRDAPYFVFRQVLRSISASHAGGELAALASAAGIDNRLLPLLNGIVSLGLPETDVVAAMTPRMRAENTERVIVEMLRHAARSRPVVLVLEDVHWMDSASWQLCQVIARDVPSIGLLLTARPSEEVAREWALIARSARQCRVALEGLSRAAVGQLIERQLDVAEVPSALTDTVFERCEGNPFHAQQLIAALRESEIFTIENGVCVLSETKFLGELVIPDSVQGLVTERFDQLDVESQTTLKVASIIGFSFDQAMLAEIHPLEPESDVLVAQLERLRARDLVRIDAVAGHQHYSFAHAITHGCIYELLPYSQRRSLNSAAASYLAERMRDDLATVYPRLAHHYLEAERFADASQALRSSGRQALNTYANKEAMEFLARALVLDSKGQAVLGSVDRSETKFSLMLAHYGLGDHTQTRAVCQQVLRDAGLPPLRGVVGLPRQLSVLAWQGARRRLTGKRARMLEGQRRDICINVMRSLSEVTAALSFQGRVWEYVHASLALYNLGARIGLSPESAIARVGYGYL
ncbi:MAG: AAA family ATPase, partial [Gammaproteobacteria bacterium]